MYSPKKTISLFIRPSSLLKVQHMLHACCMHFIFSPLQRLKSVHGCLLIIGRNEMKLEVMKMTMAIYLFCWDVEELPEDPADFAKYLYQVEKDDKTNEFFFSPP